MSKSRAELVTRALKFLGKLRAGQAPAAEDFQSVDDELDPLLENLNTRKIIYIPDPEDIDDAVFQPLARRLAGECAVDFAVDLTVPEMQACLPINAESELRALAPATSDSDVIAFEDF